MKKILLFVCLGIFSATGLFGQKIVIDAGHGWGAPLSGGGCSNPDGRLPIEMETTHSVSHKLNDLLQASCPSVDVLLTRPSNGCNGWVSLSQRTTMSDSWGADAFLSIHTNGFDGNLTGTETFWCTNSPSSNSADAGFSSLTQSNMVSYGNWYNRGSTEDATRLSFHLYVLRNTNASSLLNEIGFGDNPSDAIKLASDSWRDQFALAYFESFKSYLTLPCGNTGPIVGDCDNPIQITCGVEYSGSTFNGTNQNNSYGCSSASEFGKEKVHEFTLTQPSNIIASISGLTVDLDIHLLTNPCDSSSCIARDDYVIGYDSLPAGTYYIVVDGFGTAGSAASGSYKLNLNCYDLSKGKGTCADPIKLICGEQFKGTNANGTSNINNYSCDPSINEFGKEKIHQFTITDTSNISVTLSNLGYDLDIHLATSCNNSSCIARDDNTINYSFLLPGTYYVIVDGFGSNATQQGNYTLTLNCTPVSGGLGVCSNPIPVMCGMTYVGSTADGTSNFNSYGCDPTKTEGGKEKYHKLIVDSLSTVNVVLQNLAVDLDLQILTNPCDPNSCIARDDNNIAMDSVQPGTYYIVVDGFGSVSNAPSGYYELVIQCTPIVKTHSCKEPILVTCGVPYNGTTTDGEDKMNEYGCTGVKEYGKEKIHKFILTDTMNVYMDITGMTSNLDILLLTDSCNPNSCLKHGYFSITIDSLLPGTYYIVVDGQGTDATAQSDSYLLTLNCVGLDSTISAISEIKKEDWIEIYPNPATSYIQINSNKNNGKQVDYSLFSIAGKLMDKGFFRETTRINMENLAKGQYIIQVTDGVFNTSQIIVKY